MMKKELENFIIESDIQLDYFEEVVEHIAENEKRILDFFKLERLPNKIKILILSYKPFKEITNEDLQAVRMIRMFRRVNFICADGRITSI